MELIYEQRKKVQALEFLGKLIEILDADMKTPVMYGWFHLVFFALSIITGILLCHYKKKADEKFVRQLLIVSSVIVVILEVYKQINYTFMYDGKTISGDYQWYAFPFQFCSTPMYVGLLAGFVRNKKLHDALCAYLATFSFFAGLSVMFYPAQVFVSTIGINIQTMICHGTMVWIAIYLLGTEYVKLEHRTIWKAIPVFAVCILIAIVLNELAFYTDILETETFNMFFISPHCEPSLPVYSLVQAVVPYPLSLIIYIAGFSAASYIILLIAMLVKRCYNERIK